MHELTSGSCDLGASLGFEESARFAAEATSARDEGLLRSGKKPRFQGNEVKETTETILRLSTSDRLARATR